MSDEDFLAIFDQIEANSYKYDFEIGDAFKRIAAEQKLSDRQEKILESEFILFRFMTGYELEGDEKPRFRPVVTYTNGSSFPNSDDITQERLAYYLKRAGETKNVIMKARYLDINYEYNSTINKTELVPRLIDAYIEASKVEGHGNEADKIDCIARALLVGIEHEKQFHDEYIKAKTNLLDSMRLLANENLRWCIELLEIVIRHRKEFSSEELQFAHEVAIQGVSHYGRQPNSFMILESYIKLEHQLSAIVKPDDYDPARAAKEEAQLYIDEADSRKDSPFIQQNQLLKAEQIFRKAGLNREANELHKQIEALGKTPEFNDAFKEFSFEQTIPLEELEKLRVELVEHEDKLALIAMSRNFMPSWKNSKKEGSTEQYASISDMISSITYNNDGMPVAKAPNNAKQRRTMRYYDASMGVSNMLLVITLKKVVSDGDLTFDDMNVQLQKIKKLSNGTYESVKVGFEHLFEGRYFEALSILIPQLEDLLGDLVAAFGMSRYRQSDEELVEYKTLGPILSDLKKILGDDVYHFLHYQLIDPAKENLRNITGHGKLKKTTPDLDQKSMIILQAYLAVLVPIKPLEEIGEDISMLNKIS